MNRKLKKFLKKDIEFAEAIKSGKDIYAVAAARFFDCNYEDCLEEKDNKPNPLGQYRRGVAKKILCAMYFSTKKKYHKAAFNCIQYFDFNGYKLGAIK